MDYCWLCRNLGSHASQTSLSGMSEGACATSHMTSILYLLQIAHVNTIFNPLYTLAFQIRILARKTYMYVTNQDITSCLVPVITPGLA